VSSSSSNPSQCILHLPHQCYYFHVNEDRKVPLQSYKPHKKHNMSKQTYNRHFTCCLATLRGGFATLSTYASFVCRTGVDFAMDCWMLVVKAFNFASLSSRHLYKVKIQVTHKNNAVKLPHIIFQDTILHVYKGLPCEGQDRRWKWQVLSKLDITDL
jgi:hypothetical protein